jgi:M6 family metalloprotease-like protein
MVFVDFPDAPGSSENAAGLASMYTTYLDWFPEVSNGRFSWNVTVVPTWFRMPASGRSYGTLQVGPNGDRYLADAVAAAGGAVDFSRYRSVVVVPSSNSGVLAASNFVRTPGRGVVADGTEIRFGVLHSQSRRGAPFESSHMNHLLLASLGTSDLGESSTKPLGHWDPNFTDGTGARTAHLLGWHKWMLRWLDAEQLTCVHAPGTVEETLTPTARAGGKKLVVVPTSPSTAFVIEVRRKVGYDRGICREGVLVYTIDSQILSGNGPIEGKSAGTGCSPDVMPFAVGEVYEDATVKVEVLATDGSAYRVRVTKK